MSWTFSIENGDLVRNPATGRYDELSDKYKLDQDVRMVLSTDTRDSTGVGCGLDDVIGKDVADPVSAYLSAPIMFHFQMLVRNGLERLRRAQRTSQYSQRTAAELIYDFSPVSITLDKKDPRNVLWTVYIYTVDSQSSFALSGTVVT